MANVGNISLFKKKETDEILYPYTHRDAVLNDDGSNPFDELNEKLVLETSKLSGEIDKQKETFMVFRKLEDCLEDSVGLTRAICYLGKTNNRYRIIPYDVTMQVGISGYEDEVYENKITDTGWLVGTQEIFLDSNESGLYYKIVFRNEDESVFTEEQISGIAILNEQILTDTTLTKAYVPADALSVAERIRDSTSYLKEITPSNTGSTRHYVNLYQPKGWYTVDNGSNQNVWWAIQGYEDAKFSGNRVYDSGRKYEKEKIYFDGTETYMYYRIVFGTDTTFNGEVSECHVYALKNVADALIENDAYTNSNILTVQHGATNTLPANTLGLYKQAYKKGIMYWECDVRPCIDDYVLCHDDDICKYALNSDGSVIESGTVLISENTIENLKTYKFGIMENGSTLIEGYKNETIPTLKEFLLLAKALGACPVVEIKFAVTETQMIDVCNIIKSVGMIEQTYVLLYQGVDRAVPWACANGIKRLSLIINNGECSQSAVDTAYTYISPYIDNLVDVIFNCSLSLFDEDVAQYASTKQMRMGVWTVGSSTTEQTLLSLFESGCTMFTTNEINVSKKIFDYYQV